MLVLLVIITMAVELGLHYFPWRMVFKGKELHRVAAYVMGLLGLMVPFSVWLWFQNERQVIMVLWIFIIAGGLTVMSLYGLDHHLDLQMRDIEHQEKDELRKMQDGAQG